MYATGLEGSNIIHRTFMYGKYTAIQKFRNKYLFNPETGQNFKRTLDILSLKPLVKCLLNGIVIKLRKLYIKM